MVPNQCALWFQVADVDTTFKDWSARGVEFAHGPRKSYWGYGAEFAEPRRILDSPLGRAFDEGAVSGATGADPSSLKAM